MNSKNVQTKPDMSNHQEINELQNKIKEIMNQYNDLKNESDVLHQDISNQITSLKEDVIHAHEDAHSKDDVILNINMFIAEFKGMHIDKRLSSLVLKYESLKIELEENKTQTKLNQRTMTIIYLASTFVIGICAIAVPLIVKFVG